MDKLLGPNKPPEFNTMNIHEVVERVRQLVEAEASGNLTIATDYDPSIPNVRADRDLLIQAVLNIVKNAAQAIDENGKITLKTRVQRNITIGRQLHKLAVKIDVIDTGPGIDPDIMDRIFYPMITSRAEGTGLGLSIAQSLINQHCGMIECHSEPGNTVFSIILPL
jgi:two-component system nitrogen regulation sensor histidine kinase GlnL